MLLAEVFHRQDFLSFLWAIVSTKPIQGEGIWFKTPPCSIWNLSGLQICKKWGLNTSRSENQLVFTAWTAEIKLSRRKNTFSDTSCDSNTGQVCSEEFCQHSYIGQGYWWSVCLVWGFFPHCCSCSGKIPGDSINAIMPAKLCFWWYGWFCSLEGKTLWSHAG